MEDFVISNMVRAEHFPLFGGAPTPYYTATLTLSDGSTLTVSQYATEWPDWRVDNYFGHNGMPHWVHGAGDRTTMGHNVTDDVSAALNLELGKALTA